MLSPEEWHAHLNAGEATVARHGLARGFGLRAVGHESFRSGLLSACLDHVVAVRLAGRAEAERTLDGVSGRAMTSPGSVTIVPAGQESSWTIRGSGKLLHMFVPPTLLTGVAEELGIEPAPATQLLGCLGSLDDSIAAIARTALREFKDGFDGADLLIEALTTQLAVYLIRGYSATRRLPESDRSALPLRSRRLLIEFIESRMDRTTSLSEMAAVVGLAPSRFSERFKATFQTTPHAYLLGRRVARAAMFLADTQRTLSDVALSTGFSSQSHFTKVFRQHFGVTPRAYRNVVAKASTSDLEVVD